MRGRTGQSEWAAATADPVLQQLPSDRGRKTAGSAGSAVTGVCDPPPPLQQLRCWTCLLPQPRTRAAHRGPGCAPPRVAHPTHWAVLRGLSGTSASARLEPDLGSQAGLPPALHPSHSHGCASGHRAEATTQLRGTSMALESHCPGAALALLPQQAICAWLLI